MSIDEKKLMDFVMDVTLGYNPSMVHERLAGSIAKHFPEQPVDCRDAFEEWCERDGIRLSTEPNLERGGYLDLKTHTAWLAWQVAWNPTKREIVEVPKMTFVDALIEAKKIVKKKEVFKKFIDGTPLENDIAVWMAEFAVKGGNP